MKAKEYLRDLQKDDFSDDAIGGVINSLTMEFKEQFLRSKSPSNEGAIAMLDTVQDKWRSISLKSEGKAPISHLMFYILGVVFKMDVGLIKLWEERTRHKYLFDEEKMTSLINHANRMIRLRRIINYNLALSELETLEREQLIENDQGEDDA